MAATQYQIMYRYISERTNTTVQGIINEPYIPTEKFIVHNSMINIGNDTQRQQEEEKNQAMIAEANDVSNSKYSMFFIYDKTKKIYSKKFVDPEIGYVIRDDDVNTIIDLDKANDGNVISYYPPKKDENDKNYVRNSEEYDKAFSFIKGTLVCRKSAFDKQYNNFKSNKFIKNGEDGEASYTWEIFKYDPPEYDTDGVTIKKFKFTQGLAIQKNDFINDIINSTIVKFKFEDKDKNIDDIIKSVCAPLDSPVTWNSKSPGTHITKSRAKYHMDNKLLIGNFTHVPLYIYDTKILSYGKYTTYYEKKVKEPGKDEPIPVDSKREILGIPTSEIQQMGLESGSKIYYSPVPAEVNGKKITPTAFDSDCMFKECIITDEQFETMTIPAHEEEDFNNPPYVIKDVYKRIDIDPWIAGPISNSLESALEKVKSLVSVIGFNNVKLIKLVPLDEFLKIS